MLLIRISNYEIIIFAICNFRNANYFQIPVSGFSKNIFQINLQDSNIIPTFVMWGMSLILKTKKMEKHLLKVEQVITLTHPSFNEGRPFMTKVLMLDAGDLGFSTVTDAETLEVIPMRYKLHSVKVEEIELLEINKK